MRNTRMLARSLIAAATSTLLCSALSGCLTLSQQGNGIPIVTLKERYTGHFSGAPFPRAQTLVLGDEEKRVLAALPSPPKTESGGTCSHSKIDFADPAARKAWAIPAYTLLLNEWASAHRGVRAGWGTPRTPMDAEFPIGPGPIDLVNSDTHRFCTDTSFAIKLWQATLGEAQTGSLTERQASAFVSKVDSATDRLKAIKARRASALAGKLDDRSKEFSDYIKVKFPVDENDVDISCSKLGVPIGWEAQGNTGRAPRITDRTRLKAMQDAARRFDTLAAAYLFGFPSSCNNHPALLKKVQLAFDLDTRLDIITEADVAIINRKFQDAAEQASQDIKARQQESLVGKGGADGASGKLAQNDILGVYLGTKHISEMLTCSEAPGAFPCKSRTTQTIRQTQRPARAESSNALFDLFWSSIAFAAGKPAATCWGDLTPFGGSWPTCAGHFVHEGTLFVDGALNWTGVTHRAPPQVNPNEVTFDDRSMSQKNDDAVAASFNQKFSRLGLNLHSGYFAASESNKVAGATLLFKNSSEITKWVNEKFPVAINKRSLSMTIKGHEYVSNKLVGTAVNARGQSVNVYKNEPVVVPDTEQSYQAFSRRNDSAYVEYGCPMPDDQKVFCYANVFSLDLLTTYQKGYATAENKRRAQIQRNEEANKRKELRANAGGQ